MIIYECNEKCYKCKEMTTYYTYLIYHEYELDVVFPIDMGFVHRVYAEMPSHKDNPYYDNESETLNFPAKVLGDDDDYDDQVIKSGYFPNIKSFNSNTANKSYAANYCEHCGAPLGNYHLREIVTLNHLKPNIAMKKNVDL